MRKQINKTSHAGKYANKTSAKRKQINKKSHAGKYTNKKSAMRQQITEHLKLEIYKQNSHGMAANDRTPAVTTIVGSKF